MNGHNHPFCRSPMSLAQWRSVYTAADGSISNIEMFLDHVRERVSGLFVFHDRCIRFSRVRVLTGLDSLVCRVRTRMCTRMWQWCRAVLFLLALTQPARSLQACNRRRPLASFPSVCALVLVQGLDPEVRKEAWPFLLGLFKPHEGAAEREESYEALHSAFTTLLRHCQVSTRRRPRMWPPLPSMAPGMFASSSYTQC